MSIIEDLKALYLFECDKGWEEALLATFEPWSEKVSIISKYVSDVGNDNDVTLD